MGIMIYLNIIYTIRLGVKELFQFYSLVENGLFHVDLRGFVPCELEELSQRRVVGRI